MSGKTGMLTALSSVPNEPKFSMQGRGTWKRGSRDISPAPGTYGMLTGMPEKTKYQRSPQPLFGSSVRLSLAQSSSAPGPGTYEPKGQKFDAAPMFGFGTSQRKWMDTVKKTPGPATYDIRGDIDGVSVSVASRYKRSERALTPGPGTYGLPKCDHYDTAPKFGFGTSTRPPINGIDNRCPGPGSYPSFSSIGSNPVMRTAPKFTMKPRREALEAKGNNFPGPAGAFTVFG